MPRTIIVQVWQLGLLNKLLQIGVLVYFFYSMVVNSTWAYQEVATNRVNAWIEGDDASAAWAASSASMYSSFPYCGSNTYDFTYSSEFAYTNTHCEALNSFELSTKLPGTAYLATVYLDITEEGWDCSATDAATRATACTNGGGTLSTQFGTQCLCVTRQTTYPISTDQMTMAFDHAFSLSEQMESLEGSSSVVDDPLTTTEVEFQDGTKKKFSAGSTVRLSIADWLRAAESELTLDSRNTEVPVDSTDASVYPYLRTTGAIVVLDIAYSNIPEDKSRPHFGFHRSLVSKVKPQVKKQWAGLASKAPIYEILPTGAQGRKTYKKLLRYSQGILFKFKESGVVYSFDFNFAVTQLTSAIVLLGLASTIVAFIAKYLWPTRRMIKNKSQERLAVGTRLAEIALKSAWYAANFSELRGESKGAVHVEDMVKAYKAAGADITEEEAWEIANFCITRLKKGDVEDNSCEDKTAKCEMDFAGFMQGMEGGNMISWDRFKFLALKQAGKSTSRATVLPTTEKE